MGSYNTLVPQGGYLSNVRLKASSDNGVTQADMDAAEAHAKAVIDSRLAGVYDLSTWDEVTPPVIERVASMLSSAEVLEYKYERGDTAEGDDTNLPSVIKADALATLEQIRRGATFVVASSGAVVSRLCGDALPVANVPEAEFFPASAGNVSFGAPTSQSLEEVYRTRGA
jgi:hypothetical protein